MDADRAIATWPTNWSHKTHSFYKYTTREAAKLIVEQQTLRWSSPKIFNDPFDMDFDLRVEVDLTSVRERTLGLLWDAFYSDDASVIDANNPLGRMIAHTKGIFPRLTKDEFNKEFGEAIEESHRNLPDLITCLNSQFREQMTDVKVLCLSERSDSILMWSHYAELHRGVVLEFACVPEVDSAWGAALQVKYGDMPRVFDEEALARFSAGLTSLTAQHLLDSFVAVKATDWSYEREWRVVLHRTDPNLDFQHIHFEPIELSSVFLGCQMPEKDRRGIEKLIKSRYPRTRIFVAEKMHNAFQLKFKEF